MARRPMDEDSSEDERPAKQVPKKRGRPKKNKKDSDDSDASEGGAGGKGGKASKLSPEEAKAKAHDLVRLAIGNEFTRKPLKRDEISKKVLGTAGRASFNQVLKLAQELLVNCWGYELVELRSKQTAAVAPGAPPAKKAGRGKKATEEAEDSDSGDAADRIASAATASKKKPAAGPKQCILRSALPDKVLKQAIKMAPEGDGDIDGVTTGDLEGSGMHQALDISKDEAQDWLRDDGLLTDWKRGDQLPHMGIIHLILALILVSERRCSDDKLRVQLKRLGLRDVYELPYTPSMSTPSGNKRNLDAFLDNLVKLGYLEKQLNKRMQGLAENPNGDAATDWLWGARAEAEIGEKAVAAFMLDFFRYDGTAKEIEEGKQKHIKNIEGAAGSALAIATNRKAVV